MSCEQIWQAKDSDASWFVDDPPRSGDIVPAIDLNILIACPFGDGRLWIRFGLSPLVNRVPS